MKTHYDTMGLARDATAEQIKAAYRSQRGALHPDREGGDTEEMAALNAAYTVLSDPEQRAQYDLTLPDVERDAMACLAHLLAHHGANDDDPIASTEEDAGARLSKVQSLHAMSDRAISNFQKHIRKIKRKAAGKNLLQTIMEQHIATHQAKIEEFEHGEKVLGRVLELLDSHEYEQPPEQPQAFPQGVRGPFGIDWGAMGGSYGAFR